MMMCFIFALLITCISITWVDPSFVYDRIERAYLVVLVPLALWALVCWRFNLPALLALKF